jgi:hypothetical protein
MPRQTARLNSVPQSPSWLRADLLIRKIFAGAKRMHSIQTPLISTTSVFEISEG